MPFEEKKPPNNPFGGPALEAKPKKEDKPGWAQDLPALPLGPWEVPHKDYGQFEMDMPPLQKALYDTELPSGGTWNPTFEPELDMPGDWENPAPSVPYKDYPTEMQANLDYWDWYSNYGPPSAPHAEIDGRHYWDPWDPNDPNRPPMPPRGHNPPPLPTPERAPIETQYYDDEAQQAPKFLPGMPFQNPFLPQMPQLPPRNAG